MFSYQLGMGRPRNPNKLPAPVIPPAPLVVPDHSWMDTFKITQPRRREFLIAYELYGNVNVASRHINLNPFDVYKWRDEKDEKGETTEDAKAFRLGLTTCEENRVAALENEARRRAFAGSDILLIFMLKGARPNVYRDNAKIEHEYPNGPGVVNNIQQITAPPISITTPEHLERVVQLAAKYNLTDRLFPARKVIDVPAVVLAAPNVPPAGK